MMNQEIEKINPIPLPFDLNDKIFRKCVCEDYPDCGCGLESYNDGIKNLLNISGVNEELLGK